MNQKIEEPIKSVVSVEFQDREILEKYPVTDIMVYGMQNFVK